MADTTPGRDGFEDDRPRGAVHLPNLGGNRTWNPTDELRVGVTSPDRLGDFLGPEKAEPTASQDVGHCNVVTYIGSPAIRRIQDNIVIVGLPDAAAKESRDRVVTALIDFGLQVIPIHHLREATSFLEGQTTINPATVDVAALFEGKDDEGMDFAEVNGQENVKRAIEIAAAGEPPHLEAAPRRAKAA